MYSFVFVSLFLLIVYAIAEQLTGTNQSNSLPKMLKRLAKQFRLQFIIQIKLIRNLVMQQRKNKHAFAIQWLCLV